MVHSGRKHRDVGIQLAFSLLLPFSFYSFWSPSPWDGAIHSQGISFLLPGPHRHAQQCVLWVIPNPVRLINLHNQRGTVCHGTSILYLWNFNLSLFGAGEGSFVFPFWG